MTSPNGRIPPRETPSPGSRYLGNGALWTDLYPNPIRPRPDDVRQDGAIEIKFGWWRRIPGRLTIEGRRLDAVAPPLSAWIPGGYGRRGFQSTAITFPTAGCWQVTGSVGNASLTFVSLILEPTRPAAGGETSNPVARVPDELTRRRVVFTRANGTYVARADGSALRKLLDLEGVFEFQADVSPDGARLLLRVDDDGRRRGTWIVGLDGSRHAHVAGPGKPVAGGAADWAPDGRFVLAGKRAGERFLGLYVFAGKGSNPRRITPDEWEAQYPAWSPDGSRIAFTHVVPPNEFDIWVVNVDGSGLRQLTGEPGSDNYPAWSPDGRAIVYSSDDRSERNGLWIMGADGSEQRYLAAGGEPQWEPGEWIVFDCDLQDPERPGQVCVVRPDGSELARLPLGREAVFPNWVP